MSKTGSVGSSFGGSDGVDSSVAGGVACSFSVGAAVSGRRSDSSVFFSGSLGCGNTAVLWSTCSGTSVGWAALSDTLAGFSAERLSVLPEPFPLHWGRCYCPKKK